MHRENLLKTLLVCGECGSRFCTALSTSGPTYKYAAKIKRGCTPRTCLFGADVQQCKLNENSVHLRSDQISRDKNLLKECVHEYIDEIILYKPSPLWVLVVVHFLDCSERWGTIKNVRYAKKEVKRDGEFRYTIGFSGWFIDNDRHTLSYDKDATPLQRDCQPARRPTLSRSSTQWSSSVGR